MLRLLYVEYQGFGPPWNPGLWKDPHLENTVGHIATPPVITPAWDDITGGAGEATLVSTLSLGESLQQNSIVHLRSNVGL